MSSTKNNKIKQSVDEFVNSDGGIISGDRNVTNNSEIETGPVAKPFNDDSDYEKGVSTTTDRAARYKQNIPWFAIYSYGSKRGGAMYENRARRTITKNQVEEDLVKKSKNDGEVWSKDYNSKVEKITDTIEDCDLSIQQLEKIKKIILDKIMNKDA